MTTEEFISRHLGKIGDYLYRKLTEYKEVSEVWDLVSISQKMQIMEMDKIYQNFELSVAFAHRDIMMDCLRHCSNFWCKRTLLSHIATVNKYLSDSKEDVSVKTSILVVEKLNNKISISEKRVLQLFSSFPVRPKGWIERSVSYSNQIGIIMHHTNQIFDLWVPNPYKKAEYASAT